jgi:hypothetical protein
LAFEEDLESNDVLGLGFSSEIDISELSFSKRSSDLEV